MRVVHAPVSSVATAAGSEMIRSIYLAYWLANGLQDVNFSANRPAKRIREEPVCRPQTVSSRKLGVDLVPSKSSRKLSSSVKESGGILVSCMRSVGFGFYNQSAVCHRDLARRVPFQFPVGGISCLVSCRPFGSIKRIPIEFVRPQQNPP